MYVKRQLDRMTLRDPAARPRWSSYRFPCSVPLPAVSLVLARHVWLEHALINLAWRCRSTTSMQESTGITSDILCARLDSSSIPPPSRVVVLHVASGFVRARERIRRPSSLSLTLLLPLRHVCTAVRTVLTFVSVVLLGVELRVELVRCRRSEERRRWRGKEKGARNEVVVLQRCCWCRRESRLTCS